jgi:hypothetical protein
MESQNERGGENFFVDGEAVLQRLKLLAVFPQECMRQVAPFGPL